MKGQNLSDPELADIRVETGDVFEHTGVTIEDGITVLYEVKCCTPKGVEVTIYELDNDSSSHRPVYEAYGGLVKWDNFVERVGDGLEYIDLPISRLI